MLTPSFCLALILYGEAGTQSEIVQNAVGYVVMNRAKYNPDKVSEIINKDVTKRINKQYIPIVKGKLLPITLSVSYFGNVPKPLFCGSTWVGDLESGSFVSVSLLPVSSKYPCGFFNDSFCGIIVD